LYKLYQYVINKKLAKLSDLFIRAKELRGVYDNAELNREVLNRVNTDIKDILDEFKKTNYNFVIESINSIIKNIISSM
jgi:hypothetical protein